MPRSAPSSASSSTRTSTASGSSSTASCRSSSRCGCRAVQRPRTRVFHRIRSPRVDPITDDSTLVTLRRARGAARRVPLRARPARHGPHRPRRRGRAAQLLDLRARPPAPRCAIAVKHIPGGAFSTFVAEQLEAGDVLELMTPTGRFGTPLRPAQPEALRRDRRRQRHHAGPLDAADDARGRDREPLHADLRQPRRGQSRCSATSSTSSSRATPTGSRSSTSAPATRSTPRSRGRIDREKLERWLTPPRSPPTASTSGSCAGRSSWSRYTRDTLIEHGVEREHIHLELFFGYDKSACRSANTRPRR